MLRRFSVRQVILGALGLLTVVAVVGVFALLVTATSMRHQLERQTTQLVEDQVIADRIAFHVQRQLDAAELYAHRPDSLLLRRFRADGSAVYDEVQRYLFRELRADERLLVEQIRERHEAIEVEAQLTFNQRGGEARALPGAAELRADLDRFITQRGAASRATIEQQRRLWRWLYGACGLLGVAFVAALISTARFLQQRLMLPLERLSAAAARVGAGDFAARVTPHASDELAAVAGNFNRMAERLRTAQFERARAEHRFRDLVEGLSTVVWEAEASSLLCTYVSPQAEQMFGYPAEAWRSASFRTRLIHPDDLEQVVSSGQRAMAAGEDHELIYRAMRADGSIRWVRDLVRVLLDDDGVPRRLRGVITDITATRAADEALRASEERYHTLFDRVPVGLYRTTPDGRLLDVNPALVAMMGYDSREDLLHLSAFDVYVDPTERAQWQQTLAAATGVVEVDRRHLRRDGEIIWLRDTAHAIRDASGNVLYYEGALQDVTQRLNAAELVRRSEARFRSLIENAADGVLIVGRDAAIKYQSPAVERILGYAATSGPRMALDELVHEEDRARVDAAFRELAAQPRNTATVEFRCRHRNGSWRVLHAVSTNLLDDPAVNGFVINLIDITTNRQLEEQLLHAQKMEAVGRLAGGIAHDFNNLLTAIEGYTELLGHRTTDDDTATADLGEIRRAVARAASLTRQLLAFSRRQVVRPRPTAVDTVVREVDQMLRRLITEDVPLVSRVEPGCWVHMDPGQLEQVIVNLVVNARDASPQHGIEVAVTNCAVSAADTGRGMRAGDYVLLTVTDDGCGIDADVMPFIFDPFFTTKEVGKGTGLGLATVYGIVQESGGYVFAESEAGKGTRILVYLPRIKAPATDAGASANHDEARRGSERILLVEDEQAVRSLAERVLARHGYEVLSASNGIDALQLLQQSESEIDLLITDVVMPGMGGLQLARTLMDARPQLRVLFISGYTADELPTSDAYGRTLHFLEKPFSPTAFSALVRNILDESRLQVAGS